MLRYRMVYYIILCYAKLPLYYTILYYTILYCTILYHAVTITLYERVADVLALPEAEGVQDVLIIITITRQYNHSSTTNEELILLRLLQLY